jgi:TolB-like protein/Flp pilus assembly protein TadD/DNA-binding winged helix-turn-helix (wHTH) protein
MDAAGLQHGFRVGDWLIEPSQSRATSGDLAVPLSDDQLHLLLVLARRHGEAIDHRTLRAELWPGQSGTEDRLRAAVAGLRMLLGERSRHPRYIASVGSDAYALIAHFETVAPPPPSAATAQLAPSTSVTEPTTLIWRVGVLLVELRRRNVLKVTASYLVGMWIVLQVAEVTFAPLRFPDWWMTALTILAITGLPIVATLAWAYEITPAGVVLDAGPGGQGVLPRLPRARQSIAPAIVAGVVLMAAVTGFAWWRSLDVPGELAQSAPPPEPGARSIAVLPLVDMSPAGGNAYLGDGLSEELSTRLAGVAGLRVAARTSAFEFRGRNLDVRKIGQSLGVRHVLEGSVRREGDNVRVTVQLIDTATGYHVWAGNFDRAWRDVLALQDDIALSVTDALQIVLRDKESPSSGHEVNARAIEPYLAGLATLRLPGDLSQLDRAQASFQQAIDLDPEFAGAHAGLCRTHTRRFTRTRDPASKDAAERVCRQALQLDPASVETEKAIASIALSDGKFATAAKAYAGMLQRHPSDADAYIGLGDALAGLGKGTEAEANYRRAVRAEPAYWGARTALAKHLYERGQVDAAAVEQQKAAELVPSSANVWSNLGAILQMKGDLDGALAAFRRSLQLEPSKDAYSNLGTTYFYSNRFPEAVENYERAAAMGEHDYVIQGNLADALWQAPGRRDAAVARYRRAILLAENELQATPSMAGWAMPSVRGAISLTRWPAGRRSSMCSISSGSMRRTPGSARLRCGRCASWCAWAIRPPCCVPHRSSAVCCRTLNTKRSSVARVDAPAPPRLPGSLGWSTGEASHELPVEGVRDSQRCIWSCARGWGCDASGLCQLRSGWRTHCDAQCGLRHCFRRNRSRGRSGHHHARTWRCVARVGGGWVKHDQMDRRQRVRDQIRANR